MLFCKNRLLFFWHLQETIGGNTPLLKYPTLPKTKEIIPDDLAGRAMILAKKIITEMKDALDCDGYNVVQNNGSAAGQTVFHFHMHLIPRREGDKAGISWTPGTLTPEDKEEILSKFSLK